MDGGVENATMLCSCKEAAEYKKERKYQEQAARNRENSLAQARNSIESQFKELAEPARDHLFKTAVLVYDGDIGKTTIQLTYRTKAELSGSEKDGKRVLSIKREDKIVNIAEA
jgi:hypothetical protein